MTREEQQALIQFFGTVHAQAKATDQQIVGMSPQLRPISITIKDQLEQALYSPPPPPQYVEQNYYQAPVAPTQQVPDIPAMQAPMPEMIPMPSYPSEQKISSTPELITVLQEIGLHLKRIADIVERADERELEDQGL